MAESTGKVCSVCGIDVASRPRVKDAAGRYLCQECFRKVQAARGAQKAPSASPGQASGGTPAPDEGDNSLVLQLGSGSLAEKGTRPCPECGRALPLDAVLCTNCGLNLETGKRIPIKVIKTKPNK
jgi:predicted amidophosphoribosyltransferase